MATSAGHRVTWKLASAVVMIWARAYTVGLPAHVREMRLSELESDLWESSHDPERPATASDVITRWLTGILDDLRWRWAHKTPEDVLRLLLATTALAIAGWLYAALLGPQVLPEPHGRPMRFASERPAPPPPPPPPPPR
jgi:hypothetical protein